ncbi:MAG: AmmeMemoRadiSam system protein B [Rhodospirillaceae bacterium]
MTTIRPASVAGTFYPGEAENLDRCINELVGAAVPPESMPFKAIVVPHAGYVYSGPIAATAYAAVSHLAERVRRVVLLGPAHRCAFRGVVAPSCAGMTTPLGTVPVDRAAIATILNIQGVQVLDQAFDGEHSLEVQLPFLQRVLPGASVVPLLVGDAKPELVSQVLERLWGGPETLIVISTDLSHYWSYDTARNLDLVATRAIESLEVDRLNGNYACGYMPLSGLLLRAMSVDMRATTLDLRNSGDTAGGRDKVVGYGAYGFEYAATARLSDAHRAILVEAARLGLVHAANTGRAMPVDVAAYPLVLRAVRRTFVTLTQNGALRGCVGSLAASGTLIEDVVNNSFRAAMQDPRFKPMTVAEVDSTAITVSILSHPRPITFTSERDLLEQLRPEVDGLILRDRDRQSLFLPKVWHDLPMPAQFLAHLKQKAGMPVNGISPTLQALRFTAETFPPEA